MSALTITKVRTWRKDGFCANRCADTTVRDRGMGYRAASHIACICGHDVPLCKECARWRRETWDGALS